MAYFAQVENGRVVRCALVERAFLDANPTRYPGVWIECDYDTRGGVHYDRTTLQPSADQSLALRKNYPAVGYAYDAALDAFIPPQPFASWGLNPATCFWEAPTPYPTDGHTYAWDEATTSWAAATLGV